MKKAREIASQNCSQSMTFNRIEAYNDTNGNLSGFDCPICKNKGNIMVLVNGEEMIRDCECMSKRRMLIEIKKSGLEEVMNQYTFKNFLTNEDWQKKVKQKALDYISDSSGKWFYIGGQVGAGKTHICTAIVGKFIESGYIAKYMMWRDEIVKLKANRNSEGFDDQINCYKKVQVLYIDDLFKTERGKQPTQADIDIAFEIINYRYMHKDLITIFSAERKVGELLDIDEAVGSRIYERTKEYNIPIAIDKSRNYRLRGTKINDISLHNSGYPSQQ